tara:strand:+ start:51 stop:398 length:348 start_codon:yes stop_codon:yes gene_type:complete
MKLKTEIITIDNLHSNMFVDFLNIDSDYIDNSSDISKKYYTQLIDKYNSNEDYSEEDRLQCLEEIIYDLAEDHSLDSQFILGNDAYTKEYDIDVICSDYENLFDSIFVFISWIER